MLILLRLRVRDALSHRQARKSSTPFIQLKELEKTITPSQASPLPTCVLNPQPHIVVTTSPGPSPPTAYSHSGVPGKLRRDGQAGLSKQQIKRISSATTLLFLLRPGTEEE